MNDKTATPAEATEVQKTRIRPNMARYVPVKSGSGKRTYRTDDFIARTLDGKDLVTTKTHAAELGVNYAKWGALNNGQQRMLIGNALRTGMALKENALTEAQVSAVFGPPAAPYDADAAAAAKAAREAEAAEKKAEKARTATAKAESAAAAAKAEPEQAPAEPSKKQVVKSKK